jgi:hypothetical protein
MKKMSEAKKLKPGPKRKLSDSSRKRNKKAANAKLNKNRIYIRVAIIIEDRIK